MARFAVLAALILSVGVFASCGKRRPYTPPRSNTNDTTPAVTPVDPQPTETVSFRGEGFFTSADLAGVGMSVDPRLKGQDVLYDMYGAFHRYRAGGDLEVLVLPCSSAGAASSKCETGRGEEISTGNTGQQLGKVVEFDFKAEPVVGSTSWWGWMIRSEGRLVVKVGFAQGPFYVKILWDEGGGKAVLDETKEKAVRAAKYVAGKLGR